MFILRALSLFIMLLLDIYILVTTYNMQKDNYTCKCAQTWYLKQVLLSITIIFSITVALFILFIVHMSLIMKRLIRHNELFSILIKVFVGALFFFQIYYVIMMLLTVHKLNKDNCTCVDKTFKNTLTYYSVIRGLYMVIGIIINFIYYIK